MTYKVFILLSMIFCHIVDDYYLQGKLALMKQKQWWRDNYPQKMYQYDYLVALFMHSFSWTFMIMLVPTIYIVLFGGTFYPLLFVGNVMLHMFIDNEKANEMKINLIQDQFLHIMQTVWTWYSIMF